MHMQSNSYKKISIKKHLSLIVAGNCDITNILTANAGEQLILCLSGVKLSHRKPFEIQVITH